MAEFVTPSFLENSSPADFFAIMQGVLPEDIDLSEGGHAYNMTWPTALIAGEICEFHLLEVVKLIFPEFSFGEYLDGHAKARGVTRRAATAATGEITITGAEGTVIPAGSTFSTAAVNDEPSMDYRTLATVTIPASGSVTVRVQCTQTGTAGNTPVNTIVLVGGKNTGITGVTNEAAVTGGTEAEDDESLRSRIEEYDKSQGDSYTGSVADYKRWATNVPGVGEATVIPANDDTGLVTIIITDAAGQPATEELRNAVYNYIMRPDAPAERLAPVNANLSVVAPATIAICIKATVELEAEATIESVTADFLNRLALYLPVALDEGEVKYTRVAAVLAATEGANDFTDLQIGYKVDGAATYGTANIAIETNELPTVAASDLILKAGTV